MRLLLKDQHPADLHDRLRMADEVTAELISEVVGPPDLATARPPKNTMRVTRLIKSEAWTDAALALIDLELPQWRVRRIVYDQGEWHCALSRTRELPDWLDQSIEAHHVDLALAILSAMVDVRQISGRSIRTSVPHVPCATDPPGMPFCCDNFR